MDAVVVEADHASFGRLARALEAESDGGMWRSDLVTELGSVLEPGVSAVRSAVMSMRTGGLDHGGIPLRTTVANAVETDVRTGKGSAGVRIRVRKTGMPRGFWNAPKRLNARSWRHRVYGRNVFVTQVGAPGWFDDTLRAMHPRLRAAAEQTLQERARRISRRAP